MKVDFNNLRKQAAYSLDKVTQILNAGILSEATGSFTKDVNGQDVWRRGDVLVESDDLQRHMDSLRQNVMVLCCCFEEGNPDCADVSEEVERNGDVAHFNPSYDD